MNARVRTIRASAGPLLVIVLATTGCDFLSRPTLPAESEQDPPLLEYEYAPMDAIQDMAFAPDGALILRDRNLRYQRRMGDELQEMGTIPVHGAEHVEFAPMLILPDAIYQPVEVWRADSDLFGTSWEWVRSELHRWRGGAWDGEPHLADLPEGTGWGLDDDGAIWAAAGQGLFRLEGEGLQLVRAFGDSVDLRGVAFDHDGEAMLCGRKGDGGFFSRLEGENWVTQDLDEAVDRILYHPDTGTYLLQESPPFERLSVFGYHLADSEELLTRPFGEHGRCYNYRSPILAPGGKLILIPYKWGDSDIFGTWFSSDIMEWNGEWRIIDDPLAYWTWGNHPRGAVCLGPDGDLWLGGKQGSVLHMDASENWRWIDRRPHRSLHAIAERDGVWWAVGSSALTLRKEGDGPWRQLESYDSFILINLAIDGEGVPWATVPFSSRIYMWHPVLSEHYGWVWESPGFGGDWGNVWADSAGVIWAAGEGPLLARRDPEGWTPVDTGLDGYWLTGGSRAGTHVLAGMSGRIGIWDGESGVIMSPYSGINYQDLGWDAGGSLFVVGAPGSIWWDGNGGELLYMDDDTFARALSWDDTGRLWVIGLHGLLITWDGGLSWPQTHTLGESNLYDIATDEHGVVRVVDEEGRILLHDSRAMGW